MQGPLIAAARQILTLSCMALLQLPVLQVASAANFSYLLIYTASSGWFVAVVHLETHTWQGMTRFLVCGTQGCGLVCSADSTFLLLGWTAASESPALDAIICVLCGVLFGPPLMGQTCIVWPALEEMHACVAQQVHSMQRDAT